MKIIKTVVVKQVLTEKRKEQLLQELIDEKDQLLKELEQLKFQLQKKLKKYDNLDSHHSTRISFQKEMTRREEKLQTMDFKMNQLHNLEIGTELRDGTVQSIHEIQVGDIWQVISEPSEIIVEDGIITKIRKDRSIDDKLV
jgi:predicted nuclease with TOPRIM domain